MRHAACSLLLLLALAAPSAATDAGKWMDRAITAIEAIESDAWSEIETRLLAAGWAARMGDDARADALFAAAGQRLAALEGEEDEEVDRAFMWAVQAECLARAGRSEERDQAIIAASVRDNGASAAAFASYALSELGEGEAAQDLARRALTIYRAQLDVDPEVASWQEWDVMDALLAAGLVADARAQLLELARGPNAASLAAQLAAHCYARGDMEAGDRAFDQAKALLDAADWDEFEVDEVQVQLAAAHAAAGRQDAALALVGTLSDEWTRVQALAGCVLAIQEATGAVPADILNVALLQAQLTDDAWNIAEIARAALLSDQDQVAEEIFQAAAADPVTQAYVALGAVRALKMAEARKP